MKATSSTATTAARFLMSAPVSSKAILPELCSEQALSTQWKSLKRTLLQLGANVEVFNRHCTDKVSNMDVGSTAFIRDKTAYLPRDKSLRGISRRHFIENWANRRGFRLHELAEISDARNMIHVNKNLIITCSSSSQVQRPFGTMVLRVKMIETHPRLKTLDTVFCPLNETTALYVKEAFDEHSQSLIGTKLNLIEVPFKEALNFACNSIVIGHNVVINEGCPRTAKKLREVGFSPVAVCLSSFLGGPQKYALRVA